VDRRPKKVSRAGREKGLKRRGLKGRVEPPQKRSFMKRVLILAVLIAVHVLVNSEAFEVFVKQQFHQRGL